MLTHVIIESMNMPEFLNILTVIAILIGLEYVFYLQ